LSWLFPAAFFGESSYPAEGWHDRPAQVFTMGRPQPRSFFPDGISAALYPVAACCFPANLQF